MTEYLTVEEVCKRTKYAKQTVYNMIHKKIFVLNQHYFKPTPKKILFKWTSVEAWIVGNNTSLPDNPDDSESIPAETSFQDKNQPVSKINI